MENNKFNKFYSKKSVKDLIEQLRSHIISKNILDKEWYEALKLHLLDRELTNEEREVVHHLLSADPDTLKTEEELNVSLKKKESINQSASFGREKYPALRTIAGLYTAFAWIVGIVAIIIALYFGSKGETGLIIAVSTAVVGGLIVLGVLAVSESIKVVIDIEYNTRQSANK